MASGVLSRNRRRIGAVAAAVATAMAMSAFGACATVLPRATGAGAGGEVAGSGGGGGGGGTGGDGPDASQPDGISLDASGGYCGNQMHQVIGDPPNLYFVFDTSASMDDMAGGGFTKYQLVQNSAVQMIESLGPLINFGAATFPEPNSTTEACGVGAQVFPVSPGDPFGPSMGPNTEGFEIATDVEPHGATPTAGTLSSLEPLLVKLAGRTVVILATDGGPNCNPTLSCDAGDCVPDIEGTCPGTTNCCAPGGVAGPTGCVDEADTVAAIEALAGAKIPVVVIGVPGSDDYASVLNAMAQAGQTAQPDGPPYYYPVDDLTTLTGVLQTIAASFISCTVALSPAPATMGETNVYFDGTVVLQDPENGWVWAGPASITLVGNACAELKSGMVKEIQVLSGCPTQKAT